MSCRISNNRLYAERALFLSLAGNKYKRSEHTNEADVERGDCYCRLSQKPDKWSIKYATGAGGTQGLWSLDLIVLY